MTYVLEFITKFNLQGMRAGEDPNRGSEATRECNKIATFIGH